MKISTDVVLRSSLPGKDQMKISTDCVLRSYFPGKDQVKINTDVVLRSSLPGNDQMKIRTVYILRSSLPGNDQMRINTDNAVAVHFDWRLTIESDCRNVVRSYPDPRTAVSAMLVGCLGQHSQRLIPEETNLVSVIQAFHWAHSTLNAGTSPRTQIGFKSMAKTKQNIVHHLFD